MTLIDTATEQIYESTIAALEAQRPTPSTNVWDRMVAAAHCLFEFVLDIDERELSAAEANMDGVLRACSAYFQDTEVATADEIKAILRLAVVDLNHGWDIDIDNTGDSLMEAALNLLAIVDADSVKQAADPRFDALLQLTGDRIRVARLRDLDQHLGDTGPVVVVRPGTGAVSLELRSSPTLKH